MAVRRALILILHRHLQDKRSKCEWVVLVANKHQKEAVNPNKTPNNLISGIACIRGTAHPLQSARAGVTDLSCCLPPTPQLRYIYHIRRNAASARFSVVLIQNLRAEFYILSPLPCCLLYTSARWWIIPCGCWTVMGTDVCRIQLQPPKWHVWNAVGKTSSGSWRSGLLQGYNSSFGGFVTGYVTFSGRGPILEGIESPDTSGIKLGLFIKVILRIYFAYFYKHYAIM